MKKLIPSILLVFIINLHGWSQFSCATAVPISSGYVSPTYITTPGNNGIQDWVTSAVTSCGTASNGGFVNADVYLFSYTTGSTAGETFYFTIEHNSAVVGEHSIAVWTGCSGTSLSGCVTSTYKFDDVVGVCAQNLLANTTYYIGVSKEWYTLDGENLNFKVRDFTVETSTSQPNNECASAPVLGLNDEFTGSTRCSYTASTGSPSGCGSIENDSWVKFTATASTASIDYTVFSCTNNNGVQLSVFSGACPTPTLISGTCLNYAANDATGTWNLTGLIPGQSYYIRADGYAGDLCNYTFNPNSGISLPITLGQMTASCQDQQVLIQWETVSESNTDFFEIQKSRDLSNWISMGTVPAAGNSNQSINYTFLDDQPWNGMMYYRIKQYDRDGMLSTLNPISMDCHQQESSWKIYPNPAHHNWFIAYTVVNDLENITIEIRDISGKWIATKVCNLHQGNHQIYFEELNLESGNYWIQINTGTDKEIKKLIKI